MSIEDTADGVPVLGHRFEGFSQAVEIGRGGFGVVYRAVDDALQRIVAIKVIATPLSTSARKRFQREALVMSALSGHPNVVPVFSNGITADGQPFLVMPYLGAGSLRARIVGGPLPWQDVLRIGVRIAGAVESAHRAGIVHRDIKPDNILMSDFDEPMLADFGIARLTTVFETASRNLTASVAYAAPEVLDGGAPTSASDIYSLGATLHHLLAGRAAFVAGDDEPLVAVYLRISRQPAPDLTVLGVPRAVTEVVERAMAKQADDRQRSAAAMGWQLQAVEQAQGLAVTPIAIRGEPGDPGSRTAPLPRPSERDTVARARRRIGAAIGVALLAVALLVVWQVARSSSSATPRGASPGTTLVANAAGAVVDITPSGTPLTLGDAATQIPLSIPAGEAVTIRITAAAGERVTGNVDVDHKPRAPLPVALLFNDSPAENKDVSELSIAIDPVDLESTGTWVLEIGPSEDAVTGTASIGLAPPDVHASVAVGGNVDVDFARPRQRAVVTFVGRAQQLVVVGCTWKDAAALSASVDLLGPDGLTIVTTFGAPGSSKPLSLPAAGTYTLRATIDGDGTGVATFAVAAA